MYKVLSKTSILLMQYPCLIIQLTISEDQSSEKHLMRLCMEHDSIRIVMKDISGWIYVQLSIICMVVIASEE